MNENRRIKALLDIPFIEDVYLLAFEDIATAVQNGGHPSGRSHFLDCGYAEGRLSRAAYLTALDLSEQETLEIEFAIDKVVVTEQGHILVAGWAVDEGHQIHEMILFDQLGQELGRLQVCRHSRHDVAEAKNLPSSYPFGFFGVAKIAGVSQEMSVWGRLSSDMKLEATKLMRAIPTLQTLILFRDSILYFLTVSGSIYSGHLRQLEALDKGSGDVLIEINKNISRSGRQGVICRMFGLSERKPDISFVVCLFGKIEFVSIQTSLFASCLDDERRVEFVYVLNSPEQAEDLLREAKIASISYGFLFTIVLMPYNVGFGAATNIGVEHSKSDQVVVLNPDVFPLDRNWLGRFLKILEVLPAEQRKFFGVPLLYDDGSVMHLGMSVRVDERVTFDEQHRAQTVKLLRVEHDGKGMSFARGDSESKKVDAITGAFIAIEREVFNSLGGFDESFVFGHYEDADLCLRAQNAGYQIWLHDLPFWHLEGKGSRKLPLMDTVGTINRWFFSRRWIDLGL